MPAVPAPPPADGSSSTLPPPAPTSQGGPQVTHATTAAVLSNSTQEDKDDLSDRSLYGGNRWPRQETLALLKIRSQMDAAFRDSSLKAPLWDDVSRKLGELGYYRSAKKCREKFENVYKYHRRTKEGRSAKHEGKTYRFFDELEAFDLQNNHSSSAIPPKPQAILWPNNMNNSNSKNNNSPSHVIISPHAHVTNIMSQNGPHQTSTLPAVNIVSHQNINAFNFKPNSSISSDLFSSSTSSTASDEEFQVQLRDKKKRKWKYFFRRLAKEVLEKQEKLQEKFLEAIAKCEHERMVREQVWRMEEMARMDKEHQILAQERASAAAKDAAVIELLQKISGQKGSPSTVKSLEVTSSRPPPLPVLMPPPPQHAAPLAVVTLGFEVPRLDNGETKFPTGSTRWPRVEVEALINLRACLDVKYQEAGPKGSLWEEISAGMKRIGYSRSAKRCKEKWENINKYYKKVKESCKTRSEDSKTCPYFHQLEALYQKKMKMNNISNNNTNNIVGHVEKPLVEKMQPLIEVHQPRVQDNGDRNEEDEDGESTEEEDRPHDDDDRDETTMDIVSNYKGSSMEMMET